MRATTKGLVASAFTCVIIGLMAPAAAAEEKPGTVKVTVIGPDGKPADKTLSAEVEVGDKEDNQYGQDFKPKVKGRVVRVHASDHRLKMDGETTVFVPDGKEVHVQVRIGRTDFFEGRMNYEDGKRQEGYDEAKAAVESAERTAQETETAIDQWARENEIPIMKLSDVKKQVELADRLGTDQDKERADKLRSYKAKLEALEERRSIATNLKKELAKLSPPNKNVSGLPSACEEGQSGGLLAGLLNSATGSNTFTGICDDKEKQKDNKDRQHGREDKDREHHD